MDIIFLYLIIYPKILIQNITEPGEASIVNFQQKIIRVLNKYFKKDFKATKIFGIVIGI